MSRPFLVAFFLLSLIIVPSYAKDQPLRVAVNPYSSPFVMRGNHQIYGFDIAMMDKLCEIINRDCQYVMMNFDQIIPSIMNKNVDLGISDITITLERAKLVNFTMPYMTSRTSFLGKKELQNSVITPTFLQDKTIGVKQGSIFPQVIKSLGVTNPKIINFNEEGKIIDALINGDIDLAMLEEPTAMYWQSNSSAVLAVIGKPITFGNGLGIAVNKDNAALLDSLNNAIKQYLNSKDFKTNYHMYLDFF